MLRVQTGSKVCSANAALSGPRPISPALHLPTAASKAVPRSPLQATPTGSTGSIGATTEKGQSRSFLAPVQFRPMMSGGNAPDP